MVARNKLGRIPGISVHLQDLTMAEFLFVATTIAMINAVLIVAAAYLAVRLNFLPGVEWRWPFQMVPLIASSASPLKVTVMTSKHDKTALRIAKKQGAEYNTGQGPDINTSRRAIEVESAATIHDAMRQLRGFQKPVYIAGKDASATKAALKVTEGTTVGVMSHTGKVLKRSTRTREGRAQKTESSTRMPKTRRGMKD